MSQIKFKNRSFLFSLVILFLLGFSIHVKSQTFSPPLHLDPISSGEQALWGRKMIETLGDSVYVVYEHMYQVTPNYYSEIYFKKSTDRGSTFSAPVAVGNIPGAFQYGPSLCVDNAGNVYVSWTRFLSETTTEIYLSKSTDGGQSFNNATLITSQAFETEVAVYNNNIYVMYVKSSTGQDANYYLVKSVDGGNTFQAPVQINDEPCVASLGMEAMLSLTVNPNDGVLHAAWVDGRRANGKGDIYYAKSIDHGATFSTNIPVNDQNSPYAVYLHYFPTIALNNNGRAFIVWQEKKEVFGVPYFQRIMFSRQNEQGTLFEMEKALTDTFFFNAYHPFIDVSDNGVIGVTYSLGGMKIALSRDEGTTFDERLNVTDASADDPKFNMLSIDNLESANILFRDSRSGFDEVYFTKGNITPIDGKALVNDMAKLYIHNAQGSIQWQSSTDGNTFSDISGATTNPYSLTLLTSPSGNWYYRAKVTDPLCVNQTVTYSTVSSLNMIANTNQLQAGDKFHGGKVFFTDGSGSGLIAPLYDQSDSINWGCFGAGLPGANSFTNGQTNTSDILINCVERPIAASICDSSTAEEYSDWFLPAVQQLDTLTKQRQFFANYQQDSYWSSTQSTNLDAHTKRFSNPNWMVPESKYNYLNVRCIRAYSGTDINKIVNVHVYAANQPVAVNVISQPTVVQGCKGSQFVLDFDDEGTNISYQWKRNGIDLPGENSSSLVFNNVTVANEDTYTCELTNLCNSTETGNIQLQVVDLNLNAGPDASVCNGNSTTFNAIAPSNYPAASGNISFQWSPANGLSSVNNATTTSTPDSTIIYTVVATDEVGCVQNDNITVTVSQVYQNQSICLVSVDTTSTKNLIIWEKPVVTDIDSFKIYREIASVYSPIASIPYAAQSIYTDMASGVNPYTTAYKYKISVVDTCGNESVLSNYHRTIHVAIGPAAPCGYNLIWNDYEGFAITQYIIYRDSCNTGWEKMDSVSYGNTSWTDFICYSTNDTIAYLVEAVNPAGCIPTKAGGHNSTRSNVQRNYAIHVPLVSANNTDLLITPNPTNGKCKISYTNQSATTINAQLTISDVQGRVVFKTKLVRSETEIDLTEQPSGIYFINLTSGNRSLHQKLIKQ